MHTLLSKLLLIAGQAVVVGILLHEGPGADGLLATVAGETVLMPAVPLVLHLFRAWLEQKETNAAFVSHCDPEQRVSFHFQVCFLNYIQLMEVC